MNKKLTAILITCVAFAGLLAGNSLATLSEEKVSLADKGLDVQASEELGSIQKFATGKGVTGEQTIIKNRANGDHEIEILGLHEKFIYDGYLVIHMLDDGSIYWPGLEMKEELSKSDWIIVPIGGDIVVNPVTPR